MKAYQKIKPVQTGYYLEDSAYDGFLSIILPEKRDNFIVNPSMMDVLNNNSPYSYALSSVTTLKVIGGPFWLNYWQFGVTDASVITAGTGQTVSGDIAASVWIRSDTPVKFIIQVGATTTINSEIFTTSNIWQQFSVVHNTTTHNNVTVKVIPLETGTIQLAGFQLEQGKYPTTFVHGFGGEGYKWLGIPYSSVARRDASVIDGGRIVNLKTLGMRLTSIEGLGLPSIDHAVIPLAFKHGSLYNGMILKERDFDMEFTLHSVSLKDLLCARNNIGKTIFDQDKPRTFIWQPLDCGVPICEPVKFSAVYSDGFTLGLNALFGEEIKLSFTGYDIAMKELYSHTHELNTVEDVEHGSVIGMDAFGNLTTLPALPSAGIVKCRGMVISPYDNNLYTIHDDGSGPPRGVILRYDGNNWTKIAQTVTAGGACTAIHAVGKYLFVAASLEQNMTGQGTFSGTSGKGITRIDLSSETVQDIGDITTGTTLASNGVTNVQPIIRSIVSDAFGNVFVAGNFRGVEGTTNRHVAKFNTSGVWESLSVDFTSAVGGIRSLYFDQSNNRLYMGGDFYFPGLYDLISTYNTFMYIDFTNFSSGTPVRTDFPINIAPEAVLPSVVNSITKYKNRIVLGGRFRSSFGYDQGLLDNIAYFDDGLQGGENVKGAIFPLGGRGSGWGIPSDYADAVGISSVEPVEDVSVCNNELYISGKLDSYGIRTSIIGFTDVGTACGVVKYVSSADNAEIGTMLPDVTFGYAGITTNTECYVESVICGSEKLELVRFYASYLLDAISATVTSEFSVPLEISLCETDLPSEPKFIVEGPGQLVEISNQTYGLSLFFDITLTDDETIVLDLSQTPVRLLSTTRGDVTYAMLPASTPGAFRLFPGENSIIAKFINGTTTSATSATLQYIRNALSAESLCCDCPS